MTHRDVLKARKDHIDLGTCSSVNWAKMCVECRKAVKQIQAKSCACNVETGEQCMLHFDIDTHLLAAAIRRDVS